MPEPTFHVSFGDLSVCTVKLTGTISTADDLGSVVVEPTEDRDLLLSLFISVIESARLRVHGSLSRPPLAEQSWGTCTFDDLLYALEELPSPWEIEVSNRPPGDGTIPALKDGATY